LKLEDTTSIIYRNGKSYRLYLEGKKRCKIFRNRIGFLTGEKKEKLDKMLPVGIQIDIYSIDKIFHSLKNEMKIKPLCVG